MEKKEIKKNRRQKETGAALFEVAISMLAFLSLILGIIDVLKVSYFNAVAQYSISTAVREYTIDNSRSIQSLAEDVAANFGLKLDADDITVWNSDATLPDYEGVTPSTPFTASNCPTQAAVNAANPIDPVNPRLNASFVRPGQLFAACISHEEPIFRFFPGSLTANINAFVMGRNEP